jgi:hypothetical protein
MTMDSSTTFWTSNQVTGTVKAADNTAPTSSEMGTAVLDMQAAYTIVFGFPPTKTNFVGGQIGGETLGPGVHTFSTNVLISGDFIFSGSAADFFIIQTTGSVIQAANTKVVLSGGALAKNIFWQVAGVVEVGAGAHMKGVILAATSVKFITGSSLEGHIFSQTRVDLDMATITQTAL